MLEFKRKLIAEFRANAAVFVIASGNGAPEHPAWFRNLLANPKATVEVGADKFEALATTAKPDEPESVARAIPYLERQQKLTHREIPLVILHRLG